jgi:signal transduction histidine kinase
MDRGRIVQVFRNLLENSLQHAPQGGRVEVEAGPTVDAGLAWALCRVTDSGPGFSPEDLPRVFEPFFTRRRDGTGLGLSIVQRIVEQHGGRISAGNLPQGGAVMEVRLPVAPAAPRQAPGPGG